MTSIRTSGAGTPAPDDVTLRIMPASGAGAVALTGWTSVRVTAGIERLPRDFDIEMTERYPREFAELSVKPGDGVALFIGDDLVITGYVDIYEPSLSGRAHSIRISGRGKCADLVDCAAEWPNCQVAGVSTLAVARKLAAPYGIAVTSLVADRGRPIQKYQISYAETAYSVLDRFCRYYGLLAYDGPDGNLILARGGADRAASGIAEGKNLERGVVTLSMHDRFSEYLAYTLTTNPLTEGRDFPPAAKSVDSQVPRHRRRVVIAEMGASDSGFPQRRADWENARRKGRSAQVRATVDSWRDGAGRLWTPNTLAPLSLPALKIDRVSWLIGEVTYRRDESGTHADLVLMPPQAFQPEPFNLHPVWRDVQ